MTAAFPTDRVPSDCVPLECNHYTERFAAFAAKSGFFSTLGKE
jgi:hypothetical protein